MTFIRIFSGILKTRDVIINTSNENKKERCTKLMRIQANEYIEIDSIKAGDIGAIIGTTSFKTGDW